MKGKKRGRRWVWLVVVVSVLVGFVLLRVPLLVRMGRALVVEDAPQKADAIVVLMGSIPDRVIHGVDLYREGYAEKLIMVRTREYEDYEVVERLGLRIPGVVDINRDIALQLGVPEEALIILDYGADSTYDEAVALKEYLEGREESRLILVTSRYHSNRSKKTFDRVLGDGYQLISSPSPYDPYEPDHWWRHRYQARSVLFEYQKLINLYFFQW